MGQDSLSAALFTKALILVGVNLASLPCASVSIEPAGREPSARSNVNERPHRNSTSCPRKFLLKAPPRKSLRPVRCAVRLSCGRIMFRVDCSRHEEESQYSFDRDRELATQGWTKRLSRKFAGDIFSARHSVRLEQLTVKQISEIGIAGVLDQRGSEPGTGVSVAISDSGERRAAVRIPGGYRVSSHRCARLLAAAIELCRSRPVRECARANVAQ